MNAFLAPLPHAPHCQRALPSSLFWSQACPQGCYHNGSAVVLLICSIEKADDTPESSASWIRRL